MFVLTSMLACTSAPPADSPSTPATVVPTIEDTGFEALTWVDVEPIFLQRCGTCHLGSQPFGDVSTASPATLVDVVDPETGLAYVAPGDLEQSYVWLKMTNQHEQVPGGDGGVMPLTGVLPPDELVDVRSWILNGAPVGVTDGDADTDADADSDTDVDTDTDSDTDADTDPAFTPVRPILETHCAPCHVGTLLPAAGFRAEQPSDMVDVLDPETGLAYVSPGFPDESYLWLKLNDRQTEVSGGDGDEMPLVGLLAPTDLATIESWILQAAPPPVDTGDTGLGLYQGNPWCEPVEPLCSAGCAPAPAAVDHEVWYNRLSASPTISWDAVPGAVRYEIAIGTTPGADDLTCWIDVGTATTHQFGALYVLQNDVTYYPSVRAFQADGSVSEVVSSSGWTVDILPPPVPTSVDDRSTSVDGSASWMHPQTDPGSGFSHFEVAVGTSPGSADALDWADVGGADSTMLPGVAGLPSDSWYWVSVRAVDLTGNASQPATSAGVIRCPTNYLFVPGDSGLGTTPFCVSQYEMRLVGAADGNVGYEAGRVAESRASGTPWTNVSRTEARLVCDELGFSYQLISTQQWQAVARSIERTPSNWSGGAVGSGALNQGHSDGSPAQTLTSDAGPCDGTEQAACTDASSEDWSQKRTHVLENGELIWDLSGNAREHVDGSTGGPQGLWQDFTSSRFTTDPGFEAFRLKFAPEGPWDQTHGVGRYYGNFNGPAMGGLARGASFAHTSSGVGGSAGQNDSGIFYTHHNVHQHGERDGFRCIFVPM